MQKFIFVGRTLKGLALLFVRKSYSALKKALLLEFGQSSSAAQIHLLLATRHCRSNENLLEYFLHMKEIANRSNIDDLSLIHYVIKGINESPQSKAILFGCTSLAKFKKISKFTTKFAKFSQIYTKDDQV